MYIMYRLNNFIYLIGAPSEKLKYDRITITYMVDMLLCTRFDVSDLLLGTFIVCTGQDNDYLIEVKSTGLAPVFQLILEQLISPKLFMGVLC